VNLVGQQRSLKVLIVGTLLVFLELGIVFQFCLFVRRLEARCFGLGHFLPHAPKLLPNLRNSPLRVRLCYRRTHLVCPEEKGGRGALGCVQVLGLASPFAHSRFHFHDLFHIHCNGHNFFLVCLTYRVTKGP